DLGDVLGPGLQLGHQRRGGILWLDGDRDAVREDLVRHPGARSSDVAGADGQDGPAAVVADGATDVQGVTRLVGGRREAGGVPGTGGGYDLGLPGNADGRRFEEPLQRVAAGESDGTHVHVTRNGERAVVVAIHGP